MLSIHRDEPCQSGMRLLASQPARRQATSQKGDVNLLPLRTRQGSYDRKINRLILRIWLPEHVNRNNKRLDPLKADISLGSMPKCSDADNALFVEASPKLISDGTSCQLRIQCLTFLRQSKVGKTKQTSQLLK